MALADARQADEAIGSCLFHLGHHLDSINTKSLQGICRQQGTDKYCKQTMKDSIYIIIACCLVLVVWGPFPPPSRI